MRWGSQLCGSICRVRKCQGEADFIIFAGVNRHVTNRRTLRRLPTTAFAATFAPTSLPLIKRSQHACLGLYRYELGRYVSSANLLLRPRAPRIRSQRPQNVN